MTKSFYKALLLLITLSIIAQLSFITLFNFPYFFRIKFNQLIILMVIAGGMHVVVDACMIRYFYLKKYFFSMWGVVYLITIYPILLYVLVKSIQREMEFETYTGIYYMMQIGAAYYGITLMRSKARKHKLLKLYGAFVLILSILLGLSVLFAKYDLIISEYIHLSLSYVGAFVPVFLFIHFKKEKNSVIHTNDEIVDA